MNDDTLGALLNLGLAAVVLTMKIDLWVAGAACIAIVTIFQIFLWSAA